MLRVPEAGDGDFLFGDMVAAEWLFDVYVRDDSSELYRQEHQRGQIDAFYRRPPSNRHPERAPGKDLILGHADDDYVLAFGGRHKAVLVSDECQVEQRFDQQGRARGRLWLAAVMPIRSPTHLEQLRRYSNALDRFLLEPEQQVGFPGGYVDFARVIPIGAEDLPKLTRELVLDEQTREEMRSRWAAHAARHGPDVAADGAIQLAKLLQAGGDPVEKARLRSPDISPGPGYDALVHSLRRALLAAWQVEGKGLDKAADEFAAGASPTETLGMLRPLLETMRDEAGRVLELLQAEPPGRT